MKIACITLKKEFFLGTSPNKVICIPQTPAYKPHLLTWNFPNKSEVQQSKINQKSNSENIMSILLQVKL